VARAARRTGAAGTRRAWTATRSEPGWAETPMTTAAPISLPISLPVLPDAEDWRWQLRNRITTKEDIAARLPLTPDESAGLDAAPGHFRVAVTPYYFSLI